jgi:hypothetical protein
MEHIIHSSFDNKLYKLIINQSGKNTRQIRNITLCIDISGSMNTPCTVQDHECDGFSRFDLIKHCIYLIIEMLTENDTLTIITFNTTAKRLLTYKLTVDNKQTIKDELVKVHPYGSTNIWAALNAAYNLDDDAKILELELPDEIYLLSDGEANIHPPGGIEYCFQNLYKNEKYKKISLHALGLSNENDSRLLSTLCNFTNNGCYNFMSDASMVGPVSICRIANSLLSDNNQFKIELVEDTGVAITLEEDIDPAKLYELTRYHICQILNSICKSVDSQDKLRLSLYEHLKSYIEKIINRFKVEEKPIESYNMFIELYKDLYSLDKDEGQIFLAINNSYWKKWGKHYLLSLYSAHMNRKCHNFKDKGVQYYGCPEFKNLIADGFDKFCKIPPPVPSGQIPNRSYTMNPRASSPTRTTPNMWDYLSGSCFADGSRILLADGTEAKVETLDGTEELYYDGINSVKIKYIIRMRVKNMVDMCHIGGLVITPWHPIYDDSKKEWVFPIELTNESNNKYSFMIPTQIKWLYNIVLETGHYICVDGFQCVSMGHNLLEFDSTTKILKHSYYGTNKVIIDLEAFKDNLQIITLRDNFVIDRDSVGLVCRIRKV